MQKQVAMALQWQGSTTLRWRISCCDICGWGWGGATGQSTDMALSLLRGVSASRSAVAASVLQRRLKVSVTDSVSRQLLSEERQSFRVLVPLFHINGLVHNLVLKDKLKGAELTSWVVSYPDYVCVTWEQYGNHTAS